MIIIQSVADRDEVMFKLKLFTISQQNLMFVLKGKMLVERVQPMCQCDQAHNVWYFRAEAPTINAHAGLESKFWFELSSTSIYLVYMSNKSCFESSHLSLHCSTICDKYR